MNTKSCFFRLTTSFASLILTVVFSVQLSFGSDRSEFMPEQYNFFFRVSSFTDFLEAISKLPISGIFHGAEVRSFVESFDEDKIVQSIEATRLLIQRSKFFKGETLFAMAGAEHKMFYLMAELKSGEHAELLESLTKIITLTPVGISWSNETASDMELIKIELTGKSALWLAFCNDTLVLSGDRDWVIQSFIRLIKSEITMHDSVPVLDVKISVQYALEECQKRLRQCAMLGLCPKDMDLKKLAVGMGLDTSGDCAFRLQIGENRVEMCSSLYTGSEFKFKQGLVADINRKLPFVPTDIYAVTFCAFDLYSCWSDFPEMLEMMNREMAMAFMIAKTLVSGMTLQDPGVDFFAHMDTQFASFTQVAENKTKLLSYWELKNQGEFAASINKLFSKDGILRNGFGFEIDESEIQGFKVYSTRSGGLCGLDSFSLTVAGGNMIMGNSDLVRSALENLAGGKEESLLLLPATTTKFPQGIIAQKPSVISCVDWKSFCSIFFSDNVKKQLSAFFSNIDFENMAVETTGFYSEEVIEFIKKIDVEKFFSLLFNTFCYSVETDDSMEWHAVMDWSE
ncbi:MAG: hypothetical protein GX811_08950 [Lentisphaerae bacterium]|nr:hypothetical protein [Lentisphaerota bacterium]